MKSNFKFSMFLLMLFMFSSPAIVLAQAEYGMASYYSDKFHGRTTASGEKYNRNDLTAAHKTIDFGTVVRVTRLDNKKSIKVRINDRGPYLKGRVIDLSRRAAEALDIISDGEARVKVEIIGKGDVALEDSKPVKKQAEKSKVTETPEDYDDVAANRLPAGEKKSTSNNGTNTTPAENKPQPKTVSDTEKASSTINASPKARLVGPDDFKDYGLYQLQIMKPNQEGFSVQVAYLTDVKNVFRHIATLQGRGFKDILLSIEEGENKVTDYKIMLGTFGEEDKANSYRRSLRKNKGINGFVVNLSELTY